MDAAQKVLDLDYVEQDRVPFTGMTVLLWLASVDNAVQLGEHFHFAQYHPRRRLQENASNQRNGIQTSRDTVSAKREISANAIMFGLVYRNPYWGDELVRI